MGPESDRNCTFSRHEPRVHRVHRWPTLDIVDDSADYAVVHLSLSNVDPEKNAGYNARIFLPARVIIRILRTAVLPDARAQLTQLVGSRSEHFEEEPRRHAEDYERFVQGGVLCILFLEARQAKQICPFNVLYFFIYARVYTYIILNISL